MPLLEKPKNLPSGSFRVVDLKKRSLLWPGVYLRPWRLGVGKRFAVGAILAGFNIQWGLCFTHPKIFPFQFRNSPGIEPRVANRKVNQLMSLSTGREPPKKIPGRQNKPYGLFGPGQEVINATLASQF
jgi:hypothetical protein